MAVANIAQKYLDVIASTPYIQSVARPGRQIVKLETFTYNVVIGTAATPLTLANGSVTATLTTQADSDFAFAYMSGGVNISANTGLVYNADLTLQIQDQATGKLFFNQPTLYSLVCGAGGFPFVFPAPRVILPNASLLFTAKNRDTFQDYYQMFLSLTGTKIYYAS